MFWWRWRITQLGSRIAVHGPITAIQRHCTLATDRPTPVMETHEGLKPELSVEMEDNLIGKESRHSLPDYNRPEMLRLIN
jgi:hypothetical protein